MFVIAFKNNENLKINLKTASNEKPLKIASQKIDFFYRREKI